MEVSAIETQRPVTLDEAMDIVHSKPWRKRHPWREIGTDEYVVWQLNGGGFRGR